MCETGCLSADPTRLIPIDCLTPEAEKHWDVLIDVLFCWLSVSVTDIIPVVRSQPASGGPLGLLKVWGSNILGGPYKTGPFLKVCNSSGRNKSGARPTAKTAAMVFRVHGKCNEVLLTYWCSQSVLIVSFEGLNDTLKLVGIFSVVWFL